LPKSSTRMETIHIEKVFDDPLAVLRLVERHGPYRVMPSYLSCSPRPRARETAIHDGTLPWFRGTWATNGQPLAKGAEDILQNPHLREAGSRLFDGAEVTPSAIFVNVNAPMPPGAIHVDIPSFRGATRDRYPIQLLQAMGSSRLFEPWRILEAGAIVWFYEGAGGEYDYWPDGLSGQMRSERQPLTNRALVVDNGRMYHRIGRVGEPAARIPAISPDAQIQHISGIGWAISDKGRTVQWYPAEQIRISILWKGYVTPAAEAENGQYNTLTPERIWEIFRYDLASRGVSVPTSGSFLSDQAWLHVVHSTYCTPVGLPDC
jgi:hypothetical protein